MNVKELVEWLDGAYLTNEVLPFSGLAKMLGGIRRSLEFLAEIQAEANKTHFIAWDIIEKVRDFSPEEPR